jgi:hypothetical protein
MRAMCASLLLPHVFASHAPTWTFISNSTFILGDVVLSGPLLYQFRSSLPWQQCLVVPRPLRAAMQTIAPTWRSKSSAPFNRGGCRVEKRQKHVRPRKGAGAGWNRERSTCAIQLGGGAHARARARTHTHTHTHTHRAPPKNEQVPIGPRRAETLWRATHSSIKGVGASGCRP